MKHPIKIGVLGPCGSNGHYAANRLSERYFKDKAVEIVFINSHEEILNKVQVGKEISYGVVPIENSSRGLIREVADVWLKDSYTAKVVAEQWVEIRNCLLMRSSGPKVPTIVMSHPEALGQCRKSLVGLGLSSASKQVPTSSTAMAAKIVAESDPSSGAAAIASRFAADEYGLTVVRDDMNDHSSNETRFHLVANKDIDSDHTGNKKSFVFKVAHKAGSLVNVLKVFSDLSLNMTSIHSVCEGIREEYLFYVEVVRTDKDSAWPISLMKYLKKETGWIKCIGTFTEHKQQ
ncbi:MAG: prephenate dehydratase domain-containing protein [Candidatus Taylorbacteria bacterium]